jgi:hypothetical protein
LALKAETPFAQADPVLPLVLDRSMRNGQMKKYTETSQRNRQQAGGEEQRNILVFLIG